MGRVVASVLKILSHDSRRPPATLPTPPSTLAWLMSFAPLLPARSLPALSHAVALLTALCMQIALDLHTFRMHWDAYARHIMGGQATILHCLSASVWMCQRNNELLTRRRSCLGPQSLRCD